MRRSAATAILICLPFAVGATIARAADARVELILATEPGFPITGAQEWHRVLGELDIDALTIRGQLAADKVEIITAGPDDHRRYTVHGQLTRKNELIVPGGRFRRQNTAAIAEWLDRLRAGRTDDAEPAPERPWGLDEPQLARVRRELGGTITFDTPGLGRFEIAGRVRDQLDLTLVLDPAVERAYRDDDHISDQLRGMAAGTALAYLYRGVGLALEPVVAPGDRLAYDVGPVDAVELPWPVGWPRPESERKTLPKLYEYLTVELDNVPLVDALAAVAARLEAPILVDRLALAAAGIDPQAERTSIPSRRIAYFNLLKKLLLPLGLTYDVRLDDAQRPFVWVTATPIR